MLAKFSGVESETWEKEKENFCVVSGTYFIKRAREIRKFRVAVEQRQLRNVQEERDLLFFAVLVV